MTNCTLGIRVPPPQASIPWRGSRPSTVRAVSSSERNFVLSAEHNSSKTSRVSEIGTSAPSTRFSTVVFASGRVDSNLRIRSHPSRSRNPARLPGITLCAYLSRTCAAKCSKMVTSKSMHPRKASAAVPNTSGTHRALPSTTTFRRRTAATHVLAAPMSTTSTSMVSLTVSSPLPRGYLRASTSANASAVLGIAATRQPPMAAASASAAAAKLSSAPGGRAIEASGLDPSLKPPVTRSFPRSAPSRLTPGIGPLLPLHSKLPPPPAPAACENGQCREAGALESKSYGSNERRPTDEARFVALAAAAASPSCLPPVPPKATLDMVLAPPSSFISTSPSSRHVLHADAPMLIPIMR
mmetsp:Transcript_61122/g.101676  ORF Transcript_61122/g.101676 Transcript_61122/m.101676 type:complete len:354 (+) Transcript_61122:402-1463(+)